MPLEVVPRHQLKGVLSLELHPLLEGPVHTQSEPDHEQNPQTRIVLDCQRVCDTFGGLAQLLSSWTDGNDFRSPGIVRVFVAKYAS